MPLTITRRRFERFFIGKDIEILVKRIESGHVRLEIKAPADVPIMRSELIEAAAKKAEAK